MGHLPLRIDDLTGERGHSTTFDLRVQILPSDLQFKYETCTHIQFRVSIRNNYDSCSITSCRFSLTRFTLSISLLSIIDSSCFVLKYLSINLVTYYFFIIQRNSGCTTAPNFVVIKFFRRNVTVPNKCVFLISQFSI
jgi:hypothetical protein